MTEPRWLTSKEVRVAHERQLVRFGGPAGIRDENALALALARPINHWRFEEADLAPLAAAYAFGLAAGGIVESGLTRWIRNDRPA